MNIRCHISAPSPAVSPDGVSMAWPKMPEVGETIGFNHRTPTGSYLRPDTIVRVRDARGEGLDYDAEVWTASAEPLATAPDGPGA